MESKVLYARAVVEKGRKLRHGSQVEVKIRQERELRLKNEEEQRQKNYLNVSSLQYGVLPGVIQPLFQKCSEA